MFALLMTGLTMGVLLFRWHRSGEALEVYFGMRMNYLYSRLWHGSLSNRPAPLPASGPAILYSNHTCSSDPATLTAYCSRPPSYILAEEYYRVSLLARFFNYLGCVPARRDGRDVRSLRLSLRRLEEGRILIIFPEGGLSHVWLGNKRPSKAGIAWLALRSRAPVYPALIQGGPQTYDTFQAWFRPSRTRLTFGPPVDLSAFQGRPITRKLLDETTEYLMNQVEVLGKD